MLQNTILAWTQPHDLRTLFDMWVVVMEIVQRDSENLAIYQRLLQLGVPVELEAVQEDWRADLLVAC